MKDNKLIPELLVSMKNYNTSQLAKDVVSGIIVAIIALPLSIALALASGVGPEKGIYTAIAAGFLISAFGGSKVQIAGPTAAFATIVAGIVARNGIDGMIVATLIAGVLLILMGVFNIGSLIKFIPCTITTGFTAGIAVTILIGQLKDFMGLTYADGVRPVETLEKLEAVIHSIGTINLSAVLVGVICFIILIVWPKFNKVIPGSLISVIVGIILVKGFKLQVNTIGDLYQIKAGLPAIEVPHITLKLIQTEFSDGVTIAILAAIESLLSCVVADSMIDAKHNSNQELIGQGIGNIGSVLFGGIPATGAIARTAANIRNGGRSPIAGMVHSAVLVLVLLFLMPYAMLIPMPTIAAILFQVAYNMCGWRSFLHLCQRAPRGDILILVTTFFLTVIFDLVVAIEVGMIATCVLFMKKMSDVATLQGWKRYSADDPEAIDKKIVPKSVCVYEINGPLFFGAADLMDGIVTRNWTRVVILRMRSVPVIDATAMICLEDLYEKCKRDGVTLVLSHVNESPMRAMEKSGFLEKVGDENICVNIDAALERANELISVE